MIAPARPRPWLLWLPLALVAIVGALFVWGLRSGGEGRMIQSQLVGRPLPAFTLPPALPGQRGLSSAAFADGQPRLLNIFASWCAPCRVEAPVLEALQARGVPIAGIAIRDRPEDLAAFLAEFGNPYAAIGADTASATQIALGSSGVPETFLIDGDGVVREQIQGAIPPDQVDAIVARLRGYRR